MKFQQVSGLTLKDLESLLAAVRENKALSYDHVDTSITKSRVATVLTKCLDFIHDNGHSDELLPYSMLRVSQVHDDPNSAFSLLGEACNKFYQNRSIQSGEHEVFSMTSDDKSSSDTFEIKYSNHELFVRNVEGIYHMNQHNQYADAFNSLKTRMMFLNNNARNLMNNKASVNYGPVTVTSDTYLKFKDNVLECVVCEQHATESNVETGNILELSCAFMMYSDMIEVEAVEHIATLR